MVQQCWLHLHSEKIQFYLVQYIWNWSNANFFAWKQYMPNFERPQIFPLYNRVWHHLRSCVFLTDWEDKDLNDGWEQLQRLNFKIHLAFFKVIQPNWAKFSGETHVRIYDLVYFSHRHHFWKLCDSEQYQHCDLLLQRNCQLLLHMERPGCHQLLLYYIMRHQLG